MGATGSPRLTNKVVGVFVNSRASIIVIPQSIFRGKSILCGSENKRVVDSLCYPPPEMLYCVDTSISSSLWMAQVLVPLYQLLTLHGQVDVIIGDIDNLFGHNVAIRSKEPGCVNTNEAAE
jgi:hypothetical protein